MKFPQYNINQPGTGIGNKKLSMKLYVDINNFLQLNSEIKY